MKKLFENMKLLDLTFTLYAKDLKEFNMTNLSSFLECFNVPILNREHFGLLNGYKKTYKPADNIFINCDHALDIEDKTSAQILIYKDAFKNGLVNVEKLLKLLLDHSDTKIKRMEVGM